MYGPRYKYQAIIWPKGGGEVLDSTVIPLRPHVEPETMLAYFEGKYGPSIDSAHTGEDGEDGEDGERINIGWVFNAPTDLDLGVDPADLELVVIPMLTDPETGENVCMFIYQARLKADFLATMAAHDVNVTVVTVPQHEEGSEHVGPSAALEATFGADTLAAFPDRDEWDRG